MDVSLFLAKVLGLYLLIVSLVALINKDVVYNALSDMVGSKGLLAYAGTLSILFGLIVLILNPIVAISWKGLITLIGALALVKGILRLGFPEVVQKFDLSLLNKGYIPLFLITGLLGAYLTYVGFGF